MGSKTNRGSETPLSGSVIVTPAEDVTFVPYGDIDATNVQSAINELQDEKVSKAGDTMTGDLTVPNVVCAGNVDGRDVSVDGTALDTAVSKLAGIEAGATADQTDAEIRAAVEAATDSNVFTDADHTKLDGIETAADVTDTTNVTAAGALMDSEVDADIKTLVLPASTTISTFGASLIDDAAASDARTTLGLGALAVLGTVNDGDWSGTDLAIANGGSGQSTAQAAIDALSAVSAATDEHVLTKDTATGNAIWKAASGGSTKTFYSYTHSSDVVISGTTIAAPTAIGTGVSVTIPTKGIIRVEKMTMRLLETAAVNNASLYMVPMIGSTGYNNSYDDNGSTTNVSRTAIIGLRDTDANETDILTDFPMESLTNQTTQLGEFRKVLDIESSGITTGTQTLIIGGIVTGSDALTVKGATLTTKFVISIEDLSGEASY